MPELAQLRGPLLVTAAYVVLWYGFLLGLQTRTKYRLKARYERAGEVFDRYFGQDEEMLAVDRVVANTHEQMVPFLASLWLYAIFASPAYATGMGAAYVALRGAYQRRWWTTILRFLVLGVFYSALLLLVTIVVSLLTSILS